MLRKASQVMVAIGPEALTAVVAHLDHIAVRTVACSLLDGWESKAKLPLKKSAVPTLVRWITSKNADARAAAILILASAISAESASTAGVYRGAFTNAVSDAKTGRAVVEALASAFETDRLCGAVTLLCVLETLRPVGRAGPRGAELRDDKDAAAALARLKPTAAERIAGLVAELRDERADAAPAAAAAKLAALGPPAVRGRRRSADGDQEIHQAR